MDIPQADQLKRCVMPYEFRRSSDTAYAVSKVPLVKQMMAVLVSTARKPMASMSVDHIPTPSAISASVLLIRDTIL